jgi:cob(I)alamin adenosyltransferase
MVAKVTKGLVVINTGDGKGKTTAALGMALRAVGHGKRVAFVQFIKAWCVGEHRAAERLAPDLEVFRMGRGFVVGQPTEEHLEAAREALEFVRRCLKEGRYDMVVADEIISAVGLKLLSGDQVESLLADRPPEVHLVLTGRGAWPRLIERADLVTDMRLVKHPFQKGQEALEGIEF